MPRRPRSVARAPLHKVKRLEKLRRVLKWHGRQCVTMRTEVLVHWVAGNKRTWEPADVIAADMPAEVGDMLAAAPNRALSAHGGRVWLALDCGHRPALTRASGGRNGMAASCARCDTTPFPLSLCYPGVTV